MAVLAEGAFDDGVTAAGDLEGTAVVDLWLAPVFLGGEVGEGGGEVDLGECPGGEGDGGGVVEDLGLEGRVVTLFDLQRVVGGVEDAGSGGG